MSPLGMIPGEHHYLMTQTTVAHPELPIVTQHTEPADMSNLLPSFCPGKNLQLTYSRELEPQASVWVNQGRILLVFSRSGAYFSLHGQATSTEHLSTIDRLTRCERLKGLVPMSANSGSC
jgi:hypothetical protein